VAIQPAIMHFNYLKNLSGKSGSIIPHLRLG